jgi:group I intron endonuclease
MIGIYKYQNKQNGKIYIGRSVNITKRKWEHLAKPSPYSYFDQTLKKIGEDAFDFEIVEECKENELKDKEKYWIAYYNCCVLDNRDGGYNLTHGGEEYRSDENPWSKLSIQQVEEIIDQLAHTPKSMKQLSEEYQVHPNTISDINCCKTWAWLHNYKSNIRTETRGSSFRGEVNGRSKITEQQARFIVHLLETDPRSQAQIARDEGIKEGIINDINACKTWRHIHNYKKNIRKEVKLKKI